MLTNSYNFDIIYYIKGNNMSREMNIMISRDLYINRIRPFINSDLIKVLTGIRRSGKSVMLQLIQQELKSMGISSEQFICLNFEDLNNEYLCDYKELHKYVSEKVKNSPGKMYLFLDEIQEVTNWEKCINSFRVEFDIDIYITGSNAKMLSGELATFLAGRYVEFIIYPFSFSEFIDIRNTPDTKSAFLEYVKFGGMPFLHNINYEWESSKQYLEDLYNSVVLKDIVKRNNIRDVDLLIKIISYIIKNIGRTFSATSISRYFKSEGRTVAPETILNYIKACENAYLFYCAPRKDLIGKKILTVNEKYYIADVGIREAVFGGNTKDIEIVLENIVYMELLRRGYKVNIGKYDDKEIDFVAEKNGNLEYYQVSYIMGSEETREREFGVLLNIKDNFPKYVLSTDIFDMSDKGIIHKNVVDWLIENNS